MTNREKLNTLNNRGIEAFVHNANWEIRDIAEWLDEDMENHLSFWYVVEKESADND